MCIRNFRLCVINFRNRKCFKFTCFNTCFKGDVKTPIFSLRINFSTCVLLRYWHDIVSILSSVPCGIRFWSHSIYCVYDVVEVFDIIVSYGLECHSYAGNIIYGIWAYSVPATATVERWFRFAECIIHLDQWADCSWMPIWISTDLAIGTRKQLADWTSADFVSLTR